MADQTSGGLEGILLSAQETPTRWPWMRGWTSRKSTPVAGVSFRETPVGGHDFPWVLSTSVGVVLVMGF